MEEIMIEILPKQAESYVKPYIGWIFGVGLLFVSLLAVGYGL